MSMPNYLKQINNGNLLLDINTMPSKGYIDAVKVRDICIMILLTRTQRKGMEPGSPDIKVIHADGNTEMLTRKQVNSRFRLANGKKINMPYIRAGKKYYIVRDCNEAYKIMKLPYNFIGRLNNKSVKPGYYLVVKGEGDIDAANVSAISPIIFKKMFRIPMNSLIKRHIDAEPSREFTIGKHVYKMHKINNKDNKSIIDSSVLGLNPSDINIDTSNRDKMTFNSMQQNQVPNKHVSTDTDTKIKNVEQNKYPFEAINRVLDMHNKLIGFTILEVKTGRRKQLTLNQVAKMCRLKSVSNLMLVKNNAGTEYLKGNGIRIESLPEIIA